MKIQNDEINREMNIRLKNKVLFDKIMDATSGITIKLLNGTQTPFYFKAQRPLLKVTDNLKRFFINN
jgi:hypothetical protein